MYTQDSPLSLGQEDCNSEAGLGYIVRSFLKKTIVLKANYFCCEGGFVRKKRDHKRGRSCSL